MDIFENWTDEHSRAFRKDIITVRHRITESGLFTDEALAVMLDKHPSQNLDVCTMVNDQELYPNRFRTGDFRDCDGATLIEAAKAGKIWINARQAMNIHPEYKAVLDRMYGAIGETTGQPPFNAKGGILISSPAAKVPYHCDQTETILWHVRGKKRIYLYPVTEELMPDNVFHNIITNDRVDDIPYTPDMDKFAHAFDLQEGEMISWPLHSPHRVDNQSYCVSVTTEYSTKESAFKNSVMFTNAVLEQRFGMKTRWVTASNPEKYIKAAAGRVLRKTGAYKQSKANTQDLVDFKIDKSVPGYVVDVEPFQRSF